MNTKSLVRAIACVALCSASAVWAGDTRNVFLIISDGVRWQEVFTGADPLLLNGDAGGSWATAEELKTLDEADRSGIASEQEVEAAFRSFRRQ